MADMALYARSDGLLEPRAEKSIEFVKSNSGNLIIADIASDTRSSLQNRYLNGWIYTKQIVHKLNDSGQQLNSMPWTRDTVHSAFQDCFLVKQEYLLNGRHIKVYESTATMSKKRFCEYTKKQITPFCFEMWGIYIEEPLNGYWKEVLAEINK